MKQKIKAKNYAVFCFAEKEIYYFNIYDVITSPGKGKSSEQYYSHPPPTSCLMRSHTKTHGRVFDFRLGEQQKHGASAR
jgi:hypothetical protein